MLKSLRFILNHPLNRANKYAAVRRYVRWQVSSRLAPGKVSVPFVQGTRLLVAPGMTGATGNIYCGLHEFNDMGFVLHCLQSGDLFADIGANIGSYTVLAAGVSGVKVVCAEPSPNTFEHLMDNIRLNNLEGRVQANNVALGGKRGTLNFTSGFDTVNHIASASDEGVATVAVRVVPLDDLLAGNVPMLIKVDVEGFETEVVRGGGATFASPQLRAVLMELNGSGARYGFDDNAIHQEMLGLGFKTAAYDPLSRQLVASGERGDNSLYVRDLDEMQARVQKAPRMKVNGIEF